MSRRPPREFREPRDFRNPRPARPPPRRERDQAPKAPFTKLVQLHFLKVRVPRIRAETSELLPPPLGPPGGPAEALPLDPEFAGIRVTLAEAKAQLDAIPAEEFDRFMSALDLYRGLIRRDLRGEYQMQNATNASAKLYEIITQMGLLACESGPAPRVRLFDDASLPGAFLIAVNHYIRTMCPGTDFNWIASSYYPESAAAAGDPTILGDYYGVYAANRDRWLMGPRPNALPAGEADVSGDLTDADVVAALADAVHERFVPDPMASAQDGEPAPGGSGATLYTSDAGIDVSSDYNRQEELTALLNYGQVLCGLLSLAPGGSFVTKQYTFLTQFSRSLIALVAAHFAETYVVKPLTSRPANSEVYLVGRGFAGIDPPLADALLDRLAAYRATGIAPCDGPPLLDPTLTRDVDEALLRAARQIHGRQQVAFLNEAAALYQRYRGRVQELEAVLRADAAAARDGWLASNPVRRIRPEALLAARPPKDRRGAGAGHRPRRAKRGGDDDLSD